MAKYRDEPYGTPLYASFLAAMQEFIGTAAPNFSLSVTSTVVRVVAGTNSAQVGIGIDGLWRYTSTTVSAAVSGSAGIRDVFVTCGDNNFVADLTPPPPEMDETVYQFGLQAIAHGTTPTITGSVTHFRKVGEVDWSGSAITGLRQLINGSNTTMPATPIAATAGMIALRTVGASGQTAALQTWENSSGSTLAEFTSQGALALLSAYGTVPTSASVPTLAGGGGTPNAGSLAWGDGSGWKFNLGKNVSGSFSPLFTFTDKGQFYASTNVPVSNALISAVVGGNGLEFGHTNASGFRSTLGGNSGDGTPFLAFHAEAGASANTFKTRGLLGSIICSDLNGGLQFGNVANANADNQAFIQRAALTAAGGLSVSSLAATEITATGDYQGMDAFLTGRLTVGSTLGVTGAATLSSTLSVGGGAVFLNGLTVYTPSKMNSDLTVDGVITANGTIVASGGNVYADGVVTGFGGLRVFSGTAEFAQGVDLTMFSAVGDQIFMYATSNAIMFRRDNGSGRTSEIGLMDGSHGTADVGFWSPVYEVTSDVSLKKNITRLDPARALATIRATQGVKHSWRDGNSKRDYGFVAQELVSVLPECVSIPEDGLAGVDYMRIIPLLSEAVKYLADRVEDLESRVKSAA